MSLLDDEVEIERLSGIICRVQGAVLATHPESAEYVLADVSNRDLVALYNYTAWMVGAAEGGGSRAPEMLVLNTRFGDELEARLAALDPTLPF